jgi:hypothetical protein
LGRTCPATAGGCGVWVGSTVAGDASLTDVGVAVAPAGSLAGVVTGLGVARGGVRVGSGVPTGVTVGTGVTTRVTVGTGVTTSVRVGTGVTTTVLTRVGIAIGVSISLSMVAVGTGVSTSVVTRVGVVFDPGARLRFAICVMTKCHSIR